jgi:hypothetical protein
MVVALEAEESKAAEVLGLEEAASMACHLVRAANLSLACRCHTLEADGFADPLGLRPSLPADCLRD